MKTIISCVIILIGLVLTIGAKKPNDNTSTDALKSRETVEVIKYAKGIIRQVGETDVFMIECADKHLKLNVANLPKAYKEADLPVVFSGEIKFTKPIEDEFGEFFLVSAIH